jgi:protease IV
MSGLNRSRAATLPCVVALASLLAGCFGDSEPVDPLGAGFTDTVVRMVLEGYHPESPPPGFIPEATFTEVREKLELVAGQRHAKALFLSLGPMGGGLGQLRDVQALVRNVSAAGKPVHCHFDSLDNAGYLFAAEVCDRLSMSPAAHLQLVGFGTQLLFAADLLESLGLNAELVAIGKYKSAADVLTERDLPESTAESLGSILDQFTDELVAAIEKRATGASGRDLLDAGPYLAEAAAKAKLIDAIEYESEAREAIQAAASIKKLVTVKAGPEVKEPSFGDLFRAFGKKSDAKERGRYVAVVAMSGNILDGNRADAARIVSGPYVEHLRALADDDDAVAVLLRIDSPGGSALASDLIFREVRALAEKKPVVASISTMAASGGYYIAAGAREIFAHESSLVGSIGVIGGKIDVSPLAGRMGINVATLKRGRNAAYLSPLSPFDAHERATVRALLEATYARFVDAVAEGRKLPREKVLEAAEGRVFTAKAGKSLGLVDSLEGFEAALSRVRELGGVDESVPLRQFPARKDLFESLAEAFSADAAAESRAAALRAALPVVGESALGWLEVVESSRGPYALLPFALVLE